ncbi:uncharacterized protein LOC130770852 isoform X2 [Actinidia eriantha]|uniref:uncharacterized protein LOC130770852 isoform X2 n=1 Tax=Actinidia eriantha TaxID=165200 RepID=UPI00258EAEC7|nr:uncharacterized protein LOC130770852 isoform X2 [Actinidia eriantha]XP_057484490.1 uncharacterized protein LOC130770852 isoform X2 [Actinidia eriantha]
MHICGPSPRGPSLVSSLKDSSLHSSLRQPAFDLIQTILVSDAVGLVTSMLDCHTPPIISKSTSFELNDEDEDEGLLFARDSEEKDDSCWNEFSVQSRFTSQEFGEWMSIPMLWHYVFVEIDPLIFPVSFFKAVFWALSRLTTVEPENSTEMALPVINCLSICAPGISHLFGWKVPSGYDDGGDGKEWKLNQNLNFVYSFNENIQKNARQVGSCILEQVSNTRGHACRLQFLYSCSSYLFAVLSGLKHTLKLVLFLSSLLNTMRWWYNPLELLFFHISFFYLLNITRWWHNPSELLFFHILFFLLVEYDEVVA